MPIAWLLISTNLRAGFSAVVDVLNPPDDVPAGCPMHPSEAYQMVVEQIVETDDDLMNRYLEGEEIATEELKAAACKAIARGQLVPVVCLSAKKDIGVKELLNVLSECSLTPAEVHRHGMREEGGDVELEPLVGRPAL